MSCFIIYTGSAVCSIAHDLVVVCWELLYTSHAERLEFIHHAVTGTVYPSLVDKLWRPGTHVPGACVKYIKNCWWLLKKLRYSTNNNFCFIIKETVSQDFRHLKKKLHLGPHEQAKTVSQNCSFSRGDSRKMCVRVVNFDHADTRLDDYADTFGKFWRLLTD